MSNVLPVMVVFEDHATPEQIEEYVQEINNNGGHVRLRYEPLLKGIAATITESLFLKLQSFKGNGVVKYIEEDGVVTTQ